MKKSRNYFTLALFFLITLLIFSMAACGTRTDNSLNTEQQVSSDTTAAETIAAETTAANSNQVLCKNNRFNPDTLTVSVGTTVTWVNQDGFIHTVTSGTSPSETSGLFDSGNLNGGDTFSFTFDEPGTYDYFCIPHYSFGMIGKVIVTE